jgi:putative DNA-invertase from lambdoid prophage Rac
MADDSISTRASRRPPGVSRTAWRDQHLAEHLNPPTPREQAARAAVSPAPAGRTFAYCRVSTDMQAEDGQSLEVQRRQLEGWAMQRGAPLDHIVVEAGVSGAVPFNERPEGGRLWADIRKGDVLVASKLDRMFRSASDCLAVVEAFKARGASLFLLDLNGGADDVSGNGIARLFLTIVSAFAEFERDRIGERIRATKRQQKARGEYLGGPPPFGWSHDVERRLVPVPEQQKAIRRIQKLAGEGLSPYKISADLATRGVKLSHVTVRKIIAGRKAAA